MSHQECPQPVVHHEHDHEHEVAGLARVRHGLSEFFGWHSHETTDMIDDALEADSAGRRALWISLAALTATAIIQGVVVIISGSVALLGDTLHNAADALTAVPLLIAFSLARRPATRALNYGYGRAEDLAGIFVVVMVGLSAIVSAYESVRHLIHPSPVTHLWAVAAASVIGFIGNELVATYRIRVGRRIGSAALVADGLHARTDGITSLAVLASAGGAALGWQRADAVVGLLITVGIVGILWSTIRQVGARLMDAVDPHLLEHAEAAVLTIDGIEGVHDMRLRWIGHTLHAEAHVVADPTITLAQAHDLATHAEEHLVEFVPRLTDATIHVCPREAVGARP